MDVVFYTQRVEIKEKYGERWDCADQNIPFFLEKCGYLSIPVPNNWEIAKMMLHQFKPVGIVLTGGNSLNKYGGDAPERDALEIKLLSYALEYNPQVRSKQMNSRYYELNYASTKGRYLPSISLSGGFSTNYFINLDAASNYAKYTTQLSNNRGHYIGMSMSIPIFSGLSRRVAKHRAKLQYNNALLAHTEQRRALESEVAKTYQEMQNFGKQFVLSQKKVKSNDLAYRSVSQKFSEGMVTAIDLQTAANNLLQARSDLLHARLQYIIKCRIVDYYNGVPLIH